MNNNLIKLFFIPSTKPLKEIENLFSLYDFHTLLVKECNFCKDDNLNKDRLCKLYDEYVKVFITYKGNFRKYFQSQIKSKRFILKPYAVFGENLWRRTKSTTSLEFFLNLGYSYEYSKKLLSERQNTVSVESFKKRYGDDWKNHFDEYIKKQQNTFSLNPNKDDINHRKGNSMRYEFYLDKINPETNKLYSKDEAIEKIRKKAQKGSCVISSITKGKSGVTCRSVQYWVNRGMNEIEAKLKVKEIQSTNNIETYIKKYGEQDGIKKWLDRNKKWGEMMKKKRMLSGHIGCAYSKSSKIFFDKLMKIFKDNGYTFEKVYYGENEFSKWDKENKRPYFYDFVIPEINLCIEYNGLKFHPKEGDVEWKGLYGETYEYKLNYDKQKNKVISDCGFNVIVIWEDEDLDDKINEILTMIKK